ncbi:carbonic anhydrase [Powellomyces hirtus]|uniref:carbonic anhydrase n=1 Tax=Powellomyces hirtus TaxID=109895 RepID=A0A507EB10_9FUNG|nr:carbonic anhydrase [Powellomyces hirtus]
MSSDQPTPLLHNNSSEREFSPLDSSTIAERIRRANEQIVPAHGHTSISVRLEQSCKDVMDELEANAAASDDSTNHGNDGTPTLRRPTTLRRAASKRGSSAAASSPGSATPGETLRKLSKLNPSMHIQREHMSKFLSGFRRFHNRYFADNTSVFSNLQHGQAPKTLLIGCCDSRCDPAIITDCDPGDIFVVRNVANLVPPYIANETGALHGTSAAMEFAVKGLKVASIIVLGHTQCGGIAALLKGDHKGLEFIESWMRIAQRAKETTLKNFSDKDYAVQARACEHASILCSLQNLTTYPWIKERLATGEISINGWYFDFSTGDLLAYDPDSDSFQSILDGGQAEEEAAVPPSPPALAEKHQQEQQEQVMGTLPSGARVSAAQ